MNSTFLTSLDLCLFCANIFQNDGSAQSSLLCSRCSRAPFTHPSPSLDFFSQQRALSIVLGAGNQQRLRPCRVQKHLPQKVHQQCTTTEWNSLSSNPFAEWMWMDSETTFWYNSLFCSACKLAEATGDLLGTVVLWWNPTYYGTSPRRLSNQFGSLKFW